MITAAKFYCCLFFLSSQVFAASIGTVLDSFGVENGLDDFRSSPTLNFSEFEYYLSHEVFSCVCDIHNRTDLALMEKYIDEVCWTLTKSKLDWNRRNSPLDKETAFKLFRIFCLLADLVRDDEGNAQVREFPIEHNYKCLTPVFFYYKSIFSFFVGCDFTRRG